MSHVRCGNRGGWLLGIGLLMGWNLVLVPAWGQDGVRGAPVYTLPAKSAAKSDQKQGTSPAIRIQSNLVSAPVTVVNDSGNFVYDLRQSDFQVFDNGVPQQIARFDTEDRPLAVVILIQTNHAVAPVLDSLKPIGPVITQLLLGPQGQAAVVYFDDQIHMAQDFSNSGDVLDKTLEGLRASGDKARLNDALMRAIGALEHRPKDDRRIILAISSGFDSGSETTRDEVVRRATGAEVTIYGLALSSAKALLLGKPQSPPNNPIDVNVARPMPPGMPLTPDMSQRVYENPAPGGSILKEVRKITRSKLSSSDLKYFANFTGGVVYPQGSPTVLQTRLDRIAAEIHSQYELAYVPNDLSQTGFHRIEINVQQPGLKIRTRAGYFYYHSGTR